MMSKRVYVGVDTTAGKRPATVAVLDKYLNVSALKNLSMDDAAAFLTGYEDAYCGIDAPSQVNPGLLAKPTYRKSVELPPRRTNYAGYRTAEFELRRRRIYIYNTPTDVDEAPGWMTTGWNLYATLEEAGFVLYPGQGARLMAEVYPHGCYTVLLGKRPLRKNLLEGRIQRQLMLLAYGIDVPDPMKVMEEWTRHRFMQGEVYDRGLYSHDQLDALMAAYTMYLLDRHPSQITALGDPADGQVLLPVASLKERY